MKTTIKVLVGFGMMVLLVIGCNESGIRYEQSKMDSTTVANSPDGYKSLSTNKDGNKSGADTVSISSGSSNAAVENPLDTMHKFSRTADIKFRVGNVEKATYKIEDIVTRHGGFVTYTKLSSTIDNSAKTLISADSTAETSSFTVINSMVIRVPNTKLDTTLKDISKLVGFLDYRIIKATDILKQQRTNDLLQRRTANYNHRLAHDIDLQPKKLETTAITEETLLNSQANIDNAQMENQLMEEQYKFSTVKLEIYQPQATTTIITATAKQTPVYEAGLGIRLLDSLKFGWNILEVIFVAITSFWVFILMGITGYLVYKKYWTPLKGGGSRE